MKVYFDEKKVQVYLNESLNSQIRRVRQKVIDNITFIDEKTFNRAIENATRIFIREIGNEKYAVLWDCNPFKSKRWVYYKIENLLRNKPQYINYFPFEPNECNNLTNYFFNSKIKNIVIFDDAIYSGGQMKDLIKGLIDSINYIYENKIEVTIHIVVGFSTTQAIQLLKSLGKNNIRVKIYSYQNMALVEDVLNDSELRIINNRPNNIKGKVLTYFQHKIPDSVSFPIQISYLMHPVKKPYSENTSYGIKERIKWFLIINEKVLKVI